MIPKNHKINCQCAVCKIIRKETAGISNYINNKNNIHPRYIDGRTHKIYYCIICNKKIGITSALYGSHKCAHCSQTSKKLSEEHKLKVCKNLHRGKGKNSSNWRGGKSFEKYGVLFNKQLKERIRVRDNFICQLCKTPELEFNIRLSIHHIDYDKKNCNENNLISLCNSCHQKTNSNQMYWTNFFQEKNNGIKINRK